MHLDERGTCLKIRTLFQSDRYIALGGERQMGAFLPVSYSSLTRGGLEPAGTDDGDPHGR